MLIVYIGCIIITINIVMIVKLLQEINVNVLLDCYNKIESNITWTDYGHKGRQTGLQYRTGDDQWTSAVGKHIDDDFIYNNLNVFFKDTEFEKIINEYNLTRSRLMWVNPYACYSMHQDQTPRLHIPLITNSECYFVFKHTKPINLPIGNIYRVETRVPHTFINCSDSPRLHFVGVLES